MMSTVRKFKFIKLVSVTLVCLLILTSCSKLSQEDDSVQTEQVNAPDSQETSGSQTKSTRESLGPDRLSLRMYWQKRDTYNPLDSFDYSARAAFQLVFRPMFYLDSANILRADLIKSATYIAEKSLYELELNKGIAFSNNQLITSADCRASILAYRDYLKRFLSGTEQNTNTDPVFTKAEEGQVGATEYLHRDLLTAQLDQLDLIRDIEIIDDTKLQILLPEDYTVVEPSQAPTSRPSASLSFTKNPGDLRQKAGKKEHGESTTEPDLDVQGELELTADPGILFALTMPILPANSVNQADFPKLASAGYVLDQQNEDELVLKARNRSARIKDIHLIAYQNADAAMKALSAGDLDLVYLTEDNYYSYGKQNFQKLVSFPGQRYYYIRFGANKTIKDQEIQEALKEIWQVRDDLTQFLTGYQTINRLPLQYNDAAISGFQLFSKASDINLADLALPRDLELKIVLPKSRLLEDWALDLREKLLSVNINLDITSLDPVAYQEAVVAGNYDLAICWLNLPYPMAVEESFPQIKPGIWSDLDSREKILFSQLHHYFYTLDRSLDPKLMDDNLEHYRNFILKYYQELNILGIGFEQAGIVFGQKIEGTSTSRISFPYADLEDLWLWP